MFVIFLDCSKGCKGWARKRSNLSDGMMIRSNNKRSSGNDCWHQGLESSLVALSLGPSLGSASADGGRHRQRRNSARLDVPVSPGWFQCTNLLGSYNYIAIIKALGFGHWDKPQLNLWVSVSLADSSLWTRPFILFFFLFSVRRCSSLFVLCPLPDLLPLFPFGVGAHQNLRKLSQWLTRVKLWPQSLSFYRTYHSLSQRQRRHDYNKLGCGWSDSQKLRVSPTEPRKAVLPSTIKRIDRIRTRRSLKSRNQK
jgi:hypothetical protein